mmetsp:Transcript_45448/g.138238  ORF Transcript_45448/g.138238 Transcript_45448/m.138238 type:complete len:107 (-) Transcript_45448:92-412(-)
MVKNDRIEDDDFRPLLKIATIVKRDIAQRFSLHRRSMPSAEAATQISRMYAPVLNGAALPGGHHEEVGAFVRPTKAPRTSPNIDASSSQPICAPAWHRSMAAVLQK